MKLSQIFVTILLAATSAIAVAHADLKITERTTFDFSKLTIMGKPASPEELGMIKKSPIVGDTNGIEISIFDSGKMLRLDAPMAGEILDLDAKTATLLIPSIKQYTVSSITPNQASQILGDAAGSVNDLKQTKTILGHQARLYGFNISNMLITLSGTVWTAQDMPDLSSSAFSTMNPLMGMIVSKVKGFPLDLDGQIDVPMAFGPLGIRYVVKSISTDALPASTFAIPSGYTKSDSLDAGALGLLAPSAPSK